jgi:hypothetical protein
LAFPCISAGLGKRVGPGENDELVGLDTPTSTAERRRWPHPRRPSTSEAAAANAPTLKLILSGTTLELLATADNRRIKIRTAVVAVVALLSMYVSGFGAKLI